MPIENPPQPSAPASASGVGTAGVFDGCHSLIDPVALMEHFDGDLDLLHEITETFLAHCPELVGKIGRAIAARDAESLRCAAHSLKGSVANFGAREVVDVAFQLEQMGANGRLDSVDATYVELLAQMENLQTELTDLVNHR